MVATSRHCHDCVTGGAGVEADRGGAGMADESLPKMPSCLVTKVALCSTFGGGRCDPLHGLALDAKMCGML